MSRRHALGLLAAVPFGLRWTVRSGFGAGTPPTVEPAPGLVIRPRSAWAAGRAPVGALSSEDARFLIVHHTASSNDVEEEHDVIEVLRQTFDFHTGPRRRWPDVCYNFFVDRAGRVWEGREGSLAGAVTADATGGSQGFAQLACLIGDFTHELPTAEALEALTRLLAWLADRDGIDTAPGAVTEFVSRGSNRWPMGTHVTAPTISGHRDMSATACPGDLFYPYLVAEVPARVTRRRAELVATTVAGSSVPTAPSAPVSPPVTVTAVSAPADGSAGPATGQAGATDGGAAPDGRGGGSASGWYVVGGAMAAAAGAAAWARRPARVHGDAAHDSQ